MKKKKPAGKGGRKTVDTGKIMALHRAGWNNAKIADEMNLSAVTIGKYVRQLSESEKNEN